jgi:hypothetical protein
MFGLLVLFVACSGDGDGQSEPTEVDVLPLCGVPAENPSRGECYAGQFCNRMLDSCGPQDRCMEWNAEVRCMHGSGENIGLCEPCRGYDCAPGFACLVDKCAKWCCSDDDCGGVAGSCQYVTRMEVFGRVCVDPR